MEKGVRVIMEDIIKELLERLLRANSEILEIKERGYQHQIELLHDEISRRKDTILTLKGVILEFKDEVKELKEKLKKGDN